MTSRWSQQTAQPYNNFAWVKNTRCLGKTRFRSISHALKTNLAKDHKKFRADLARKGEHRSLTAVYMCPHCGHYHNGGRYRQLFTVDVLVVCSHSIVGKLVSTGFTPNSRRARVLWDNRQNCSHNPNTRCVLQDSGYTLEHLPHPNLELYWIYGVVLPAEEATLWLLKKRIEGIQWYIPDQSTKRPINLNDYS